MRRRGDARSRNLATLRNIQDSPREASQSQMPPKCEGIDTVNCHELAIDNRDDLAEFGTHIAEGTNDMIEHPSPYSIAAGVRALVAACIVAAAAFMTSAPASAASPPEAYVQENVQRGLQILNNHSIPDVQRRAQFRDFLTGLTDIRRIALFTLGSSRRTASPADLESFVNAFRDYAIAVYESRLTQYSGQTLKVVGSTDRAPGDTIVSTVLVDPSAKTQGQQPIEVDFRVLNDNGRFVVIDVSIAGVWLAIEERDQFSAFLEQNNDSVPALVSHLNGLTRRIRAGIPNTPGGPSH
jgi:phospholipid transport system substrate-binding protein